MGEAIFCPHGKGEGGTWMSGCCCFFSICVRQCFYGLKCTTAKYWLGNILNVCMRVVIFSPISEMK